MRFLALHLQTELSKVMEFEYDCLKIESANRKMKKKPPQFWSTSMSYRVARLRSSNVKIVPAFPISCTPANDGLDGITSDRRICTFPLILSKPFSILIAEKICVLFGGSFAKLKGRGFTLLVKAAQVAKLK